MATIEMKIHIILTKGWRKSNPLFFWQIVYNVDKRWITHITEVNNYGIQ